MGRKGKKKNIVEKNMSGRKEWARARGMTRMRENERTHAKGRNGNRDRNRVIQRREKRSICKMRKRKRKPI